MGLLTDPSTGQGKITKTLIKYHSKFSILLYITGVLWFFLLAYTPINSGTYFSENALLPGLVKSEFRDILMATLYYEELLDEMKKYDNSIPYPWLLAKFRQAGLDTYTHNFTLNYPLGKSHTFTGKNVYSILRAGSSSSTEALVLSVPYRPPSSINPTTAPSIAIMLTFASFASKRKYWSKDIIFLITEHEQLGIQAWLEAYHSVTCGHEGVLNHGDLKGRAGAIQAAVNLEFHDVDIGKMDIKVEGLNGQLPNLDLFNLATKMCSKEGIIYTFKNREKKSLRDPFKEWNYAFKTLMTMVFSQATGIPNGNHGLFHRFGIQALTLEGFTGVKKNRPTEVGFVIMGRILEGMFRSLNNLLERFHQSYFFYLLCAPERFISIGLYMPAVCLIAGALFLKACGKWYKLQRKGKTDYDDDDPKDDDDDYYDDEDEDSNNDKNIDVNLVQIGAIILLTHVFGITIMNSPNILTYIGSRCGYSTELSIYTGFVAFSLISLLAPSFVTITSCQKSMTILNILILLELGTILICLSMVNFSLGLLIAALYVPIILLTGPSNYRIWTFIQKVLWIMAHPLLVLTITVIVYTFITFPGETFYENINRGFLATQQAIAYSFVDSMIYSNWLYNVITAIMVPSWLCFWCMLFTIPKLKTEDINNISALENKKND